MAVTYVEMVYKGRKEAVVVVVGGLYHPFKLSISARERVEGRDMRPLLNVFATTTTIKKKEDKFSNK